jgi:hypothetical protein
MKTYKIPVVWQMHGYVEVEAESMSEAVNNAMDAPLPEDGSYIEGSFEVDKSSFVFVDHLTKGSFTQD